MKKPTRRQIILGGMAFGISGCVSPTFKSLYRNLEQAFSHPLPLPLTREDVNRLPYATILVRHGKRQENMLVLGRYDGPDLHWVSTDWAVLVTRGGRLVRTVGFPQDLMGTRFLGTDPLARLPSDRTDLLVRATRIIDLRPPHLYGQMVGSTLSFLGHERIEIKELVFETAVYAEDNIARDLDWAFRNLFWSDVKTGFVWKSIQYFSPNHSSVEITVLKPAA